MLVRLFRSSLPPAVILLACVLYRVVMPAPQVPAIAPKRLEPCFIAPRYDVPQVATDEQLVAVLDRMRPPAGPPNTNVLVHALRLWGPRAEFADPQTISGPQMLAYFLDDRAFRRMAGDGAAPLWIKTPWGLAARAYDAADPDRHTGSVHVDDLLATLAESGVALDEPLVTRSGTTTVAALLEGALERFHLEQAEYEWSAISYARYAFPQSTWQNHYGHRIDTSAIIDELLDHPLREGVCGGTHRLEALVVLARADEAIDALSRSDRRRVIEHMANVSRLLVAAQHPEGYWTKRWPEGVAAASDEAPLADRILATGHHLEWLALAPAEVLPPRESIVRAAQWLVRAMLEVDDETIRIEYGPFSHGARALCLWRSRDPFEVWSAHRASAPSTEPIEESDAQ